MSSPCVLPASCLAGRSPSAGCWICQQHPMPPNGVPAPSTCWGDASTTIEVSSLAVAPFTPPAWMWLGAALCLYLLNRLLRALPGPD